MEQRLARALAPRVQRIVDDLTQEVKERTPPEKVWRSMGDPAVRPTHRRANAQGVPENLRFLVGTPEGDRGEDPNPFQLLRFPRDRTDATIGNWINCRCFTTTDFDGVRKTISGSDVRVSGTRVTGRVLGTHDRIIDCEYGTDKDFGARMFGRALAAAAATLR
jgi:hypothetical protein